MRPHTIIEFGKVADAIFAFVLGIFGTLAVAHWLGLLVQ